MIDNYLDYVKQRRKFALREARRAVHASRKYGDPVVEAFYRGLFVDMSLESRRWRVLQKDIESVLKASSHYDSEDASFPLLGKFY